MLTYQKTSNVQGKYTMKIISYLEPFSHRKFIFIPDFNFSSECCDLVHNQIKKCVDNLML